MSRKQTAVPVALEFEPRATLSKKIDPDQLSRRMSQVLRHNAVKEGLALSMDGFVALKSLLSLKQFNGITVSDIQEVVDTDRKGRYTLKVSEGGDELFIRANQGHTLSGLDSEVLLTRITDARKVQTCIHGTYHKAWGSISKNGLNRMTRNHIHFAAGERGDADIISGMRSSCEILIYMNVPLMLEDGIPLFISDNNVLLSPGVDGIIDIKYFLKVVEAKTKYLCVF